MIEIGTKLGGRFFVIARQDRPTPGNSFEVRDARAQVFWAQWLHEAPLAPVQLAQLRAELAALPTSPSLLLPTEVVATEGGIPAAIYPSAPPKLLTAQLAPLSVAGQESRRLAALRVLVRWMASLAEDAQRIHAARVAHGAISLEVLFAVGDGETARPILGGFILDAAARIAKGAARAGPRVDLAAIVITLQALMERVGAKPSGSALVKWDVLLNCARAGDHPALNSGSALAKTLHQLIDDEESALRARTATPKIAPAIELSPLEAPAPDAPRFPRRGLAWAAGAVLALAAGAVALWSGREPSPSATAPARAVVARCSDEPAAAVGLDLPAAPNFLDLGCRADSTLTLFARSGGALLVAERPAERGRAFTGAPATLGDSVVGAPSWLVADGVTWVAWRNRSGTPFGLTRLQGAPLPERLELPGWESATLRGVWLLRVDAGVSWVAANAVTAGTPSPMVFRLSTADGASAYQLGEGEILAAIAGTPATLLVRVGDAIVARSVSTPTLPALATAEGDAGATAPRRVAAAVLPTSEPWHVANRWTVAVPRGAEVTGGARHFALTLGEGPRPAGCDEGACNATGEVTLLSFAERGAPVAVTVTPRGRATGLGLSPEGTPQVAGIDATTNRPVLWGATGATLLRGARDGLVAASRCGDQNWVASATPPTRVTLTPLPCAILNEAR